MKMLLLGVALPAAIIGGLSWAAGRLGELQVQADPNDSVVNPPTVVTVSRPAVPLAPNPAATGGDLTQVCQAPNVQPHSPLQQKSLSLSKKLDQIQGLVGADNREIEDAPAAASFPSSAIVHINSSLNSCTGFIYAPDMVVTAGHCVFERDFEEIPNNKQWATGIVVSPGRTNTVCPYGSCTASRLYTTRGWAEEKNDEFDYGAIKLDCSVGYKTGWLGLDWNGLTASSNLTLIGYRGLSDPMKPRSQLTMTAPPSKLETRIVYYEHDTLPGDSGAPLFTGDMIARVIHGTSCHLGESDSALNLPHPVDDLHCWTTGPDHVRFNYGVRITNQVVANLLAWRAR